MNIDCNINHEISVYLWNETEKFPANNSTITCATSLPYFFFICAFFESNAWLQRGPLDRVVAVLWVAKMRSSGPQSFQTRET